MAIMLHLSQVLRQYPPRIIHSSSHLPHLRCVKQSWIPGGSMSQQAPGLQLVEGGEGGEGGKGVAMASLRISSTLSLRRGAVSAGKVIGSASSATACDVAPRPADWGTSTRSITRISPLQACARLRTVALPRILALSLTTACCWSSWERPNFLRKGASLS